MTGSDLDNGRRERWLFLGSGLVLIVAVLIGLAREQRWGQPMLTFRLISSTATGLRPGQEVRISGLPVGQLRSLQLQPDASVAIAVEVARRYAPLIGPTSVARQGQEGLIGDRYLEISPDPQPAGMLKGPNGQRLRYEQPLELGPMLQQLVQTQKDLQTTLRNTTRLTANDLPQTLREARLSLSSVHRLATILQRESAATAPDLRHTLRQISRTGSNIDQTSTQAQQLLRASQPELIRTLADIQALTNTSQQLLQNLLGLFSKDTVGNSTKATQP